MKDLIKKINELKVGESLQISPTFKVTCKSFLQYDFKIEEL